MALKIVNGVKYYPVNERIQFGLESMYEKASTKIECDYYDGNMTDEEYDHWDAIREECIALLNKGSYLCGKDYARAKQITNERELMRYNKCIAAGMSDRDAGKAFG